MSWKWDDTLCLILIVALFGLVAWFYPTLPDPVPTHWNMAGEVDGYMAKPWGAVLPALIAAGTWVVLRILPFISPKGFRMESFMPAFRIMVLAIVAMTTLVSGLALLAAAGYEIGIAGLVTGLVGVLLIVVGNYLGKVRRNFFVGIRTPWTLASEEVWYRTHRLGGWLFVLAGLVFLVGALAGWGLWVFLPAVLAAALVPVLYSLWCYHRVEGFGSNG